MADDEVQITLPLGYSYLASLRSQRHVTRIKALAGVSRVARALHEYQKVEPVEDAPRVPVPVRAPVAESHELLTPQTAAALSQIGRAHV